MHQNQENQKNTMKNIQIAVACHKPSVLPTNALLMPVQVGSAIAARRMEGMRYDDEGENISAKDVERKFAFRNGKTEIFFRGVSGRVFSRRAGKNFYSAETLALIIRVFITLEKGFVFLGVSVRVKVEFYFIHYLV